MSFTEVEAKYISAAPVMNNITPFLVDQPVRLYSGAGTTLYGANHPGRGSTTKYQKFIQSISGNRAFALASAMLTPLTGAVAAADQLRTVVVVSTDPTNDIGKTPLLGATSAAVPPVGGYCVGAGGGTAVADATLSIKGTTAADLLVGSTKLSIASSGADTQTILVGDIITVAGDTTLYYATATTISLNGTTEIEVVVTPPVQVAQTAGLAVTIAASTGKTILTGTSVSIPVGATVEVFVFAAADVVTITGGAMTADRQYVQACMTFMHCAGNVSMTRGKG